MMSLSEMDETAKFNKMAIGRVKPKNNKKNPLPDALILCDLWGKKIYTLKFNIVGGILETLTLVKPKKNRKNLLPDTLK